MPLIPLLGELKGFPLYIPHIERNGRQTPLYVAGYRNGITLLKKL